MNDIQRSLNSVDGCGSMLDVVAGILTILEGFDLHLDRYDCFEPGDFGGGSGQTNFKVLARDGGYAGTIRVIHYRVDKGYTSRVIFVGV